MKWFNSHFLFNINQELMSLCSSEPNLFGQVESYIIDSSDIRIRPQRTQSSTVDTSFITDRFFGSSSVERHASINDILPVHKHPSNQTFPILKSAIEIAFPDFDFSNTRPDHFVLIQSPEEARSKINWALQTYFPAASDEVTMHLWAAMEKEIQPGVCDIYSYEPNCTDAFTAMGAVWNMSYLFYNIKQRKILHFHLREGGKEIESGFIDDDDELEFGEDNYYD